jgi:Alcohol dehydrogenase GroES-like domain
VVVCRTNLHVVEGDLPRPTCADKVASFGENVSELSSEERVGIAWLRRTCRECRFARSQREDLCKRAEFNGWTANGGFAAYHMSPIPSLDYSLVYQQRVMHSVANSTRDGGRQFLEEAARIPYAQMCRGFRLDEVNGPLIVVKHDAIKGC